ncbi:MAG: hypothetical protein HYT79_02250 [Elusimicrobia bacterium]|nr:hypothetical protein [Elusimicrobiota bacterium]
MIAEHSDLKKTILDIAAKSLRSNIRKAQGPDGRSRHVVTAGAKQFRTVWARDFGFTAGGLIKLGETGVVRDTLEAFLAFQKPSGLFPHILDTLPWYIRVAAASLGLRLPFEGRLKPYYTNQHFVIAIDSGLLLTYAAELYLKASGDVDFAVRYYPALKRGLEFYQGLLKDGLIAQPPCADFQDTVIARRGRVFFTNLIYWKACLSLSRIAAATRNFDEAESWNQQAARLKENVERFFWIEDAGYFRNTETSRQLSSDGNLFAILWDFVDGSRSNRILKAMDQMNVWTPSGPRCTVPPYSWREIEPHALFAGVSDYHDSMVWMWQSALSVQVERKMGRRTQENRLIEAVQKILERDAMVCEVYDPLTSLPARRWLYRSEGPFSWASAMLLEAI